MELNIKAYIHSDGDDSHWRRQPYIYSIEPLCKTEYWLGVCHDGFHLHRLTRLQSLHQGKLPYNTIATHPILFINFSNMFKRFDAILMEVVLAISLVLLGCNGLTLK